jgi:hypothetical protein
VAQALKQPREDEQITELKHSLKKRLHAWWQGYGLRAVAGDGSMPCGANGADDAADAADTGDGAEEDVPS